MAYSLSQKGALKRVGSSHARAWTRDRRLLQSGNLAKAYMFRVKEETKRLNVYLTSKGIVKDIEL
jgi:hypothetical protein